MENMDASALASAMLEWESVRRKLDEIEGKIKVAVLNIGKTQTVGNVRATYSAGRKSYDYKAAIETAGKNNQDDMGPFTSLVIDYRTACKDLEIDSVPFTQSSPSVSVKLIG